MGLESVVYVVDYDIPTENATRRVDFYRKVHRLLRERYGKEKMELSSKRCYFTHDEELAKMFLDVVKKFGKGNMYQAKKMR